MPENGGEQVIEQLSEEETEPVYGTTRNESKEIHAILSQIPEELEEFQVDQKKQCEDHDDQFEIDGHTDFEIDEDPIQDIEQDSKSNSKTSQTSVANGSKSRNTTSNSASTINAVANDDGKNELADSDSKRTYQAVTPTLTSEQRLALLVILLILTFTAWGVTRTGSYVGSWLVKGPTAKQVELTQEDVAELDDSQEIENAKAKTIDSPVNLGTIHWIGTYRSKSSTSRIKLDTKDRNVHTINITIITPEKRTRTFADLNNSTERPWIREISASIINYNLNNTRRPANKNYHTFKLSSVTLAKIVTSRGAKTIPVNIMVAGRFNPESNEMYGFWRVTRRTSAQSKLPHDYSAINESGRTAIHYKDKFRARIQKNHSSK